MKQLSVLLLAPVVFFTSLLIYSKLFGPIPFSVNSVNTVKQDTFNVTGEGKATVIPDIAIVNLGVQANGVSVKQVQDQLNSAANKITEVVKKLGVDSKDIKTINYSLNPTYDNQYSGTVKITGYTANSTLQIKVRDISKVNNIIDAGTGAGANQVGGISFDVDDKTKAQDLARKEAVANAKKKAEQAAKVAGFTLGKLVNYQEDFGGTIRPMYEMALSVKDATPTSPTQLEPGSNEIRINVTLSYEII